MSARAAEWVYRGVWGRVATWFKVPPEPPVLPVAAGERVESFHPSSNYVRYLKFWFWWFLLLTDIPVAVGWIVLLVINPVLGLALAAPAWAIIVLPDILAYVAIHLRYDSTWYVMTDRAIRIRRGIWNLSETTITFENVQNVHVNQGPVQRHFGIADVVITTAGGGGGQPQPGGHLPTHVGILQGLHDAERVRDQILARVRPSRSAGLGDDAADARSGLASAHAELLRKIAETAETLAARAR